MFLLKLYSKAAGMLPTQFLDLDLLLVSFTLQLFINPSQQTFFTLYVVMPLVSQASEGRTIQIQQQEKVLSRKIYCIMDWPCWLLKFRLQWRQQWGAGRWWLHPWNRFWGLGAGWGDSTACPGNFVVLHTMHTNKHGYKPQEPTNTVAASGKHPYVVSPDESWVQAWLPYLIYDLLEDLELFLVATVEVFTTIYTWHLWPVHLLQDPIQELPRPSINFWDLQAV